MKKIILLSTLFGCATFSNHATPEREKDRIQFRLNHALQQLRTLDCQKTKDQCLSLQILTGRLTTALDKYKQPWERELVGIDSSFPSYQYPPSDQEPNASSSQSS